MNKRIIATAYHEAGHVEELLLTKRRFVNVTIAPKKEADNDSITYGVANRRLLKIPVII